MMADAVVRAKAALRWSTTMNTMVYGYNSYGSHRLKFASTQFHDPMFATTPSQFAEWGLYEKLGDIYDYLIETDELCSWTLENLPYSCETTKKIS